MSVWDKNSKDFIWGAEYPSQASNVLWTKLCAVNRPDKWIDNRERLVESLHRFFYKRYAALNIDVQKMILGELNYGFGVY
jgi:hypothetical protein